MARPQVPAKFSATVLQVSGNPVKGVPQVVKGAASVYKQGRQKDMKDDRRTIAQRWQIDAYRYVHLIGEARYAVTLFAALASRAEIGISEPQALNGKAVWVNSGPEVDVLAEIAPTGRDRARLVRDYMLHRKIAGECYLIARQRREHDPGYVFTPNKPVWEIVAVTELRKIGSGENATWEVRYENGNYVPLSPNDPVIRMWDPDPADRREAWSPMRSLLPVLREIEWLTGHIFTQVRSRLMSAGVWFLPENLTYPAPPPDAVEGGAEAIAAMNEAELFMASLAASGQYELDLDEVSFPTVVLADPAALAAIDQNKLIKFWSEIDDKAMTLRNDRVRAFAIGFDLPPEQVLGSSGVAVAGSGGSAGSVNHWGEWASEEKTIAGHVEPALSDFTDHLTIIVQMAVENSTKVVAYNPASIRMKQDRSKEALELRKMGLLNDETTLRETGFDPEFDMMSPAEFRKFMLMKFLEGSPTPEMQIEALRLLGQTFPDVSDAADADAKGVPGRHSPPSLEHHPVKGPPQGDHTHQDAPYAASRAALLASAEGLVLRALEKAGNRLLNDGKRGKDRDRTTPPHLAHVASAAGGVPEFDFTLLPSVLDVSAAQQARIGGALHRYCARLYTDQEPYSREGLIDALEGLG